MSVDEIPHTKVSRLVMERDYRLLRFLWKWKAVSTMAIARKFFTDIDVASAYRRLQFLEEDGYIGTLEIDGPKRRVWTLREKGFEYIRPKLGELESIGYKSEHLHHDFIASAFHLGEWLTRQPGNTQTYSEQQLRRYHEDIWPDWVPRSVLHRPDGYSVYVVQNKPIVVSFEAELSVKAQSRYESVVTFYDSQPTVQVVFWLLDCQITLTALKRAFKKYQMREWSKHHFLLLEDFKRNGWNGPLSGGHFKGRSISEVLLPTAIQSTSNRHPKYDALSLLDSRRRPVNSRPSPKKQDALQI